MWISDFINLFYPGTCAACGDSLVNEEKIICTYCYLKLPRTNFCNSIDNPVDRIFWGRVNLITATSFLFFNKGSRVQKLLHQLKYNGNKKIAIYLGELFGQELNRVATYNDIDLIIPVPLHPRKRKKRGFNQSELIAIGIGTTMGITYSSHYLIRTEFTSTQTNKTRYLRWKNVNGKFSILRTDELVGKHVLLVDDVLTTGATIEACAQELLKIPNIKISVATLAYALV